MAVVISIPKMPRPTDSALATLAKKIGYQLPKSYIDFVNAHDRAKPEINSIATSKSEIGVSRFIPVSEAADLTTFIDGFLTAAIPFAEDDCGNYFYIDASTGTVFFWDHEVEEGDEKIAEDALVFGQKLSPIDASSIKLAPGQARRVWVNPSFKPQF